MSIQSPRGPDQRRTNGWNSVGREKSYFKQRKQPRDLGKSNLPPSCPVVTVSHFLVLNLAAEKTLMEIKHQHCRMIQQHLLVFEDLCFLSNNGTRTGEPPLFIYAEVQEINSRVSF